MDEVWARIGLIAGALVIAYLSTLVIRARSSGSPRSIPVTGLQEGVYLFSSTACPDCKAVRERLREVLGSNGFLEMSWEESPGIFHDLGVAAVPTTLVVAVDGSGTIFPGNPDEALSRLGP